MYARNTPNGRPVAAGPRTDRRPDRKPAAKPVNAESLRQDGWREDDECRRLALGHRHVNGGPIFMRDPSGRLHAVAGGRARVLDGGYRRWAADLPKPGDDIARMEARQGTVRSVEYVDGRAR